MLAALLYRERSGKAPGYVEVARFELMAAFSLSEHLSHATFEDAGKVGYVRVLSPDRRPYRTKDAWIAVLPYTERGWTKVLKEIGRPEVAELAWFKDANERKRVDDLYAILAEELPSALRPNGLAFPSASTSRIRPCACRRPAIRSASGGRRFSRHFAAETPVKRTCARP